MEEDSYKKTQLSSSSWSSNSSPLLCENWQKQWQKKEKTNGRGGPRYPGSPPVSHFPYSYLAKHPYFCLRGVTYDPLGISILLSQKFMASLGSLSGTWSWRPGTDIYCWNNRILDHHGLQDIVTKIARITLEFRSSAGFLSLGGHWKGQCYELTESTGFYSWNAKVIFRYMRGCNNLCIEFYCLLYIVFCFPKQVWKC